MSRSDVPGSEPPLHQALLNYVLRRDDAPQGAAPRNTAPQVSPRPVETNPPRRNDAAPSMGAVHNPKPLKAIQMAAARLLLQGRTLTEAAEELNVHRYTISRWQSDPQFQLELRRQTERAAQRHTAQQRATRSRKR